MSFSPTEDIRTFAELEAQPLAICAQVRETGRPVFLTSNGKADLVIMDAKAYENQLKVTNLARLLAEGEEDIRAGRTTPVREFFDELRREKEISR
jgi:PHD/YefM family antitoxin component YafN of YafNO toxin-antitoxin module